MTQGKIQKLERQLGFASQRGLQRGGGNHSDDVKSLLDGIDYIKKAYVDVAPRELRESDKFEDHCRDLLWTIGPRLWPGVEDQQSQTEYLDDLYPRVLDFTVAVDRERLEELLFELIWEKCRSYYRNERSKPQRQRASAARRTTNRWDGETDQSPIANNVLDEPQNYVTSHNDGSPPPASAGHTAPNLRGTMDAGLPDAHERPVNGRKRPRSFSESTPVGTAKQRRFSHSSSTPPGASTSSALSEVRPSTSPQSSGVPESRIVVLKMKSVPSTVPTGLKQEPGLTTSPAEATSSSNWPNMSEQDQEHQQLAKIASVNGHAVSQAQDENHGSQSHREPVANGVATVENSATTEPSQSDATQPAAVPPQGSHVAHEPVAIHEARTIPPDIVWTTVNNGVTGPPQSRAPPTSSSSNPLDNIPGPRNCTPKALAGMPSPASSMPVHGMPYPQGLRFQQQVPVMNSGMVFPSHSSQAPYANGPPQPQHAPIAARSSTDNRHTFAHAPHAPHGHAPHGHPNSAWPMAGPPGASQHEPIPLHPSASHALDGHRDNNRNMSGQHPAATALENTVVVVTWPDESVSNTMFYLRSCATKDAFFHRLQRNLPTKMRDRTVTRVDITISNSEQAPSRRRFAINIMREDNDDGFEILKRHLRKLDSAAEPELEVVVELGA